MEEVIVGIAFILSYAYIHYTLYTIPPIHYIASIGGSIPCGPLDQSSLDTRADVLTFTTDVFTEELPLTGPLFATLYVSSDAVDTDFMVHYTTLYRHIQPYTTLYYTIKTMFSTCSLTLTYRLCTGEDLRCVSYWRSKDLTR